MTAVTRMAVHRRVRQTLGVVTGAHASTLLSLLLQYHQQVMRTTMGFVRGKDDTPGRGSRGLRRLSAGYLVILQTT